MAYLNLVGGQDQLVFDGGSMVADPSGRIVARAPRFDEAVLIVDVDIELDGPGDGPQRDDHGDSPESATAIAPDSATEGVIDPGGDRDFFRITVETAGFLTVRTTGDTDTVGTLFDATGTSLITNSEISKEDLNFLISYPVTAGIYYLEVRGYGEGDEVENGPYQLISSLQPGGPQGDDHGDTTESATVIAPDSTTDGAINPAGDLDYFRIVVETAGTLTIRTTGDTDTVGTLLDASGDFLTENDDWEFDGNFQVTWSCLLYTSYAADE